MSSKSMHTNSSSDISVVKTPEWRSATVVKTFLRFAVSSILYHRQILPSSCFGKRDFCGLKRLPFIDCVDDDGNISNLEGYKVSQWLEKGVFKAIDKKYISVISLVVISYRLDKTTSIKEVLEIFRFEIKYENDSLQSNISCSTMNFDAKVPLSMQMTKLIKSLVSKVSKEKIPSMLVPKQKSLSMVLEYTEETPDDYRPDFFTQSSPTNPLEETCARVQNEDMVPQTKESTQLEMTGAVEIGNYSSKYHKTFASYKFHGEIHPQVKRRLNFDESRSSPTITVHKLSNKSPFRSPSPNAKNIPWGSKSSFSGSKNNSSTKRPSHYPIYSPIPPNKLHIRSTNTPKSSNDRSPCWSEVPTVIVQSVTPKRL